MMRKLSGEDLKLISGGFIIRWGSEAYIVITSIDETINYDIRNMIPCGNDFEFAVTVDWELHGDHYKSKGFNDLEDLKKYYNYGDF